MGGGLLQLVAYGAQDIYLTGNPQITFFKVVYRRHTNFAMEAIAQTMNGNTDWGRRATCLISRNGDLVSRMYLQVTLPAVPVAGGKHFRWLDKLGHLLIRSVEMEIGGSRIDRHYSDWFEIYNQLTMPAGLRAAYKKMIGDVPELTRVVGTRTGTTTVYSYPFASDAASNGMAPYTLYIPLIFWFNRNPGLALPLIALQYHECKINIDFNDWRNCCWTDDTNQVVPPLQNPQLYVDYIYLDSDERKRMAQASHEYLIEQVQHAGEESIANQTPQLRLNYNHPCKMLIWVCQKQDFYSAGSSGVSKFCGRQPLNYSDQFDETAARWDTTILTSSTSPRFYRTLESNSISDYTGATPSTGDVDISDGQLGLYQFAGGKSPVDTAKLQLNGHDRFSERPGSYFDTVQVFQHFDNVPDVAGIHVYSFALKPAEHQPSGSCNMSRIDNANLQLRMLPTFRAYNYASPVANRGVMMGGAESNVTGLYAPASGPESWVGTVKVFAVNYNVLRIMSGMGGLAYSN